MAARWELHFITLPSSILVAQIVWASVTNVGHKELINLSTVDVKKINHIDPARASGHVGSKMPFSFLSPGQFPLRVAKSVHFTRYYLDLDVFMWVRQILVKR